MQLYSELTQLQSSLEVSQVGRSPSLLRPMEDHICRQAMQSSKVIGECCQDLLCFSLLVPSPPSVSLDTGNYGMCCCWIYYRKLAKIRECVVYRAWKVMRSMLPSVMYFYFIKDLTAAE